jgi:cephalosporin hydroxylase
MPYYLENSLNMPLQTVLQIMQERIMNQSTYFGVKTLKNPNDFWIYQEIIYETKPDVIVEIGNYHGGSTLALAHMCDCLGKGKVIGLDLSHEAIPELVRNHQRIILLEGDASASVNKIANLISKEDRVLVIEDSSHTYENTLNVLRNYSSLIKAGDYFIVEDSIVGHGLHLEQRSGPLEAVERFITENPDFEIDRTRESFLITWNPKGFLRRKDDKHVTLRGKCLDAGRAAHKKPGAAVKELMELFIPPIVLRVCRKLIRG